MFLTIDLALMMLIDNQLSCQICIEPVIKVIKSSFATNSFGCKNEPLLEHIKLEYIACNQWARTT